MGILKAFSRKNYIVKRKIKNMKTAALFSGGKDSTFAMYRAKQLGREIVVLVSIKSENPDSYLFHTPNIDLVELQAKAIGIPILFRKTEGLKEKEIKDLKLALAEAKRKYNIQGVVTGAVASEYQRFRTEAVCADLGVRVIAPLWHLDAARYMEEMIKEKFEIIITAVAADGFDASWLGRNIDMECLEDLKKLKDKFGIHIGGEGGEYETLVLDGPMFKRKIEIIDAEKKWEGDAGKLNIKKAKLVKK